MMNIPFISYFYYGLHSVPCFDNLFRFTSVCTDIDLQPVYIDSDLCWQKMTFKKPKLNHEKK